MFNGANTTEEIKARLNIVDVVGGYVRLEKAGTRYKACCPFHQERTPSFMVNEERGMWHCFGCGKGGDVFAFVMEMEGMEFKEALKLLAERAGVELPQYRREEAGLEKGSKDRLFELLELATKFYEKQLWDGSGKEKILAYLRERGLSDESIRTFRLGYAPDGWRHIYDFLINRGFRAEELEQAGLIIRRSSEPIQDTSYKIHDTGYYDRFRDRVMFPIFDILGRVIGYSARVAPGADESTAKYINTPETPIYHKSRALYGLYLGKQAIKQAGVTVVVEGNMDVIAMHQAGFTNTVAVSGTALTSEQLSVMKRYGSEVRLFFDMDGAGQKAARKSTELALEQELLTNIVALPFGKDAADMGRDDPELLKQAVERPTPALRYFLDQELAAYDPSSPEGKRKIVEEFTELLLFVKNPIERAHWIKELSRAIGMEEKLVVGVVNTAFLEKRRREGVEPSPFRVQGDPFADTVTSFGKRSERLREELVGLMLVEVSVRQVIGEMLRDKVETRSFVDKHPLSFFVTQAGSGDPLSLIEDTKLKSEATKLSFHILDSPEFTEGTAEERAEKMLAVAKGYLESLDREVTSRERLVTLERAIAEAKARNDKEEEKRLLKEFVEVSGKLSSS